MSKQLQFSLCDEERIIDFVKNNHILYNVRHAQFRDSVRKNQLWLKLADELNAEIEAVKKKWVHMRDYFVQMQTKKLTGNPTTYSKRDESMMFLLDTSILKRKTVTNMSLSEASTTNDASPFTQASLCTEASPELCLQIDLEQSGIDLNFENSSVINEATDGRPSTFTTIDRDGRTSSNTSWTDSRPSSFDVETPQCSRNKRRTPSSDPMTDLLRELISTRKPSAVDFLQPKTKSTDHLDKFFESIASTMRTFPTMPIAKLKLHISQIVGEEVSLAEQEKLTEVVYNSNASPIEHIHIDPLQ